jgi:hypothetical protein
LHFQPLKDSAWLTQHYITLQIFLFGFSRVGCRQYHEILLVMCLINFGFDLGSIHRTHGGTVYCMQIPLLSTYDLVFNLLLSRRQGEIGVLDSSGMDHFADIFEAFQARGTTDDPEG